MRINARVKWIAVGSDGKWNRQIFEIIKKRICFISRKRRITRDGIILYEYNPLKLAAMFMKK